MDDFLEEWGGVYPIYMQIGYFPANDFTSSFRSEITSRCEALIVELKKNGMHPKKYEFRGSSEHYSIFMYLSDEQPDYDTVVDIIRRAGKCIQDIFGVGVGYRFKHRFWTY